VTLEKILSFIHLTKYYLGNPITEDEMGRACGTCAGERNACRVLVGKREGKRPL